MTIEQRLDRIERVLDNLVTSQLAERDARLALREDLEILYQTVQQSAENTDRGINRLIQRVEGLTSDLTASVEDLVGMITTLAEDAEADRAVFQAEVRRIWEYLLGQQQNGDGRGGQQP